MMRTITLFITILAISFLLCGCENPFSKYEDTDNANLSQQPTHQHTAIHSIPKSTDCTGIEYWSCSGCEKFFSDAECKNEIPSITIFTAHKLSYVEEKSASCIASGNVPYYECTACHRLFSDSDAKQEIFDVSISSTEHKLVHKEKKFATCSEFGNIEHWLCTVCNRAFADEFAIEELNETLTDPFHLPVYREAVAATCKSKGNIQHWQCSDCGKLFSDIKAENEVGISAIEIPKLAHEYKKSFSYNESQHWRDALCCQDERSDPEDHLYENGFCTVCDMEEYIFTKGLSYKLDVYGEYYSVTGLGEADAAAKTIIIPETYYGIPVISIDSYALKGSSANEIILPASISKVSYKSFSGCTELIGVEIAEDNEYYKSIDGAIYTKDGKALIFYPIAKPDTVYKTPEGLEEIKMDAVNGCTSLKEIIIGDSVRAIGHFAFGDCSGLISVIISDGVTYIGDFAFTQCENLKTVKIGESVEHIGDNAFAGCYKLSEVHYNCRSASVNSYTSSVFNNSGRDGDGITLYVGKSVKKIPDFLFCAGFSPTYSSKLVKIEFAEDSVCEEIGIRAFEYCAYLTSDVVLPKTVTRICTEAFLGCSFKTVTVGIAVNYIGSLAFSYLNPLDTINYAGSKIDFERIEAPTPIPTDVKIIFNYKE